MTPTQLGIILCRVASAVLIVQTVQQLGFFLPTLFNMQASFGAGLIGTLFVFLVPGIAAAGLWFFAEKICAVPALEEAEGDAAAGSSSAFDYLRVGTVLIGYFFLIEGALWAVRIEAGNSGAPPGRDEFDAAMNAQRAAYVLQVTLGALLILGREQLSSLLLKAKRAGTQTGNTDEAARSGAKRFQDD